MRGIGAHPSGPGFCLGECGWGLAITAGFHAVTAREAQGWHGEEVMGTRRLVLEQDEKEGLRAQAALFGCFAGSGVGIDEQELGLLASGRGCQRRQGAEASGQPQQMPRAAKARGRDPSSPSCVRLVPLSRREQSLLTGVAAVLPGQG